MTTPAYSINIPDLTAMPQPWLGVLLAPLLNRTTIVNAEPGRFDVWQRWSSQRSPQSGWLQQSQ
jgi:hypothetical protein